MMFDFIYLLVLVLAVCVGLCLGSFLNVFIHRIHAREGFWRGRSRCPLCLSQLFWYDLVPLVSFFVLGKKCRSCKKPISWMYPAVEFAMGLLAVLSVVFFSSSGMLNVFSLQVVLSLFGFWVFLFLLIFFFVYDLRWREIPDKVVLPAIIVVGVWQLFMGDMGRICSLFTGECTSLAVWTNYGLAAILGGGFFLVQYLISRGKWIGGGDVRLGVLLGFMVGYPGILAVITFSYFIGAVVVAVLALLGRVQRGAELPLGVFLTMATLLYLFFEPFVLEQMYIYLGL